MTLRRRWLLGAATLVALQALAIGGYLLVERTRRDRPATDAPAFSPAEIALPPLALERPSATLSLPKDDEVVLLHLWATWCKPCREELPALLALDGALPVRVIAASSDENWEVIEHFFEGRVPTSVWRITNGFDRLPIHSLPSTLVVRGGEVIARVTGAREWSPASARALIEEADVAPGSRVPLPKSRGNLSHQGQTH